MFVHHSGQKSKVLYAQSHSNGLHESIIYDASLDSNPDLQGWTYLTNQLSNSSVIRVTENDTHRFNTLHNLNEMAGYFTAGLAGLSPLHRNPGITLSIEIQVLEEIHTSPIRGGFSLILLSDDLFGTELVFRKDSLFVYTEDFQIAEIIPFPTTDRFVTYTLSVINNEYSVSADGGLLFSGPVRDYSSFGIPYNTPNFIFFGDNSSTSGAEVMISRITLTGSGPGPDTGEKNILHQNAPNPFSDVTRLTFFLQESGHTRIDVLDLTGRIVSVLVDENLSEGFHQFIFRKPGLASGTYFYRLTTRDQVITKKMLHLK